jgi:hypothetical protein
MYVATSVDVKHLFSRGCNVLLHVCNHLSSQSVRTLLCLGTWCSMGLVNDVDIKKVAVMDDVNGDTNDILPDGWGVIDHDK